MRRAAPNPPAMDTMRCHAAIDSALASMAIEGGQVAPEVEAMARRHAEGQMAWATLHRHVLEAHAATAPGTARPRAGECAQDLYSDLRTGVLKNRLGLQQAELLSAAEFNLAFIATIALKNTPPPKVVDIAFFRAIHKALFKNVYSWAGQIRTVSITKGGTVFAFPACIEGEGRKLFKAMAQENYLRGLNAEVFAARAGHYLGEINMLHPFREGNGRAQRMVFEKIAQGAGFELLWRHGAALRGEMIAASQEAADGDSSRMAELIRAHLHKAPTLARAD
ncbi:cell filamentation protein Fic [Formicincola oecophyllae]|uniref:protein adenylyltransferase n=1 Tax=Formicincola oecophyllae TaxID=2558361 RepID=A0A4Y6UCF4_9PROT|nr:Fic family protein [Formicincola oecophyllae]QDH14071.1 cell filamentation protein Fic [Formicincola oecophyllae]